ncbi:MAG: LLM class flavin-dependent oxidoreductase [Solirubrobacterales bacterium]|nr:LLM class flavin-dependent oxidoreductase [Solirubrobacterales bacterium]
MEVGLQFIFQNTHEGMSDADMFRQETQVAIKAEEVGMDFILAPEHHFDPNYSMMPDNQQWLAYVAGKTNRIKLGTGAIILPWWPNPTRVAEKIAMLDILLEGRMYLGFGRGLARQEYEAFGVDMNESRQRFDQSAEIILDILDTGIAEYDTEFFKQARVEIHPAPERGFRERGFFSVAMTPPSAMAAAELGGTMMSFVQLPWEQHHEAVEAWRARFKEVHPGKDPGAPVFSDFTFCHEDPEVAEKVAREYLSNYFLSVIKHYDFDGSHWGETKGYQAYQAGADAIKEAGLDAAAEGFVQSQAWGTPEQIIDIWRKRVEMTGELRPAMAISYAGMPFDLVNSSLELIAEKVVPELQKLGADAKVGAAA